MSGIKKTLKAVYLALFIVLSGLVSSAHAVDVHIMVCPEGCGLLVGDLYISEQIKRIDPEFNYLPEATNGYLANLNEMGRNPERWQNTAFAVNDDTLSFGPRGGRHPFTTFIPKPVTEKFKLLYGVYWGVTGHYFITLDPTLKKVSDLKGKTLGLGLTGQSDWGMNPTLDLEYAYGITAENTTLNYIGPAKMGKALLSGEIDAGVAALGTDVTFTDWLPASVFREWKKSGKQLYFIGHSKDIVAKLNAELGTAYIPVTIPAKVLPTQKEPIQTFADRDFKAVHATFPEELAYRLVMHVAKIGPRMKMTVGLWQTWSPEIMVAGLSEENAHPGAIRAFEELGWWELRKKFVATTLPDPSSAAPAPARSDEGSTASD